MEYTVFEIVYSFRSDFIIFEKLFNWENQVVHHVVVRVVDYLSFLEFSIWIVFYYFVKTSGVVNWDYGVTLAVNH